MFSLSISLVSNPNSACGDKLLDVAKLGTLELNSLESSPEVENSGESSFVRMAYDFKGRNECGLVNLTDEPIRQDSFIDSLPSHLAEEDWCICDSVKLNNLIISVPLGNLFLKLFRSLL